MSRSFRVRVLEAIKILDIPWSRDSMMYSSATTRGAFLDGGFVEVDGYGFGSHSYAYIVGDNALQLVCNRVGVRPPREKPGIFLAASADFLEEMLQKQRLNNWNDLLSGIQERAC